MYLVSVYFDEKANRILRRHIELIAQCSGNRFMTDNNVPPHMTIAAVEARNADVLVPAFEQLRGKVMPGRIQIVSIGQLLPYVIYAAPVQGTYLLDMSRQVCSAFGEIPDSSVSRYYRPDSWLAHITLGKTLQKEQMRQAFAAMQQSFMPFTAEITEMGLARVNPHEDIVRFRLGEQEVL